MKTPLPLLTRDQFLDWCFYFSTQELKAQGWIYEALADCFAQNQYVYSQVDGELASVILYHQLEGDLYEVLFLGTAPQFQGRGSMSALIDRFLSMHGGPVRVWLECREDNVRARHLYVKKGFRETGRRESYYKDGTAAILFNF